MQEFERGVFQGMVLEKLDSLARVQQETKEQVKSLEEDLVNMKLDLEGIKTERVVKLPVPRNPAINVGAGAAATGGITAIGWAVYQLVVHFSG